MDCSGTMNKQMGFIISVTPSFQEKGTFVPQNYPIKLVSYTDWNVQWIVDSIANQQTPYWVSESLILHAQSKRPIQFRSQLQAPWIERGGFQCMLELSDSNCLWWTSLSLHSLSTHSASTLKPCSLQVTSFFNNLTISESALIFRHWVRIYSPELSSTICSKINVNW